MASTLPDTPEIRGAGSTPGPQVFVDVTNVGGNSIEELVVQVMSMGDLGPSGRTLYTGQGWTNRSIQNGVAVALTYPLHPGQGTAVATIAVEPARFNARLDLKIRAFAHNAPAQFAEISFARHDFHIGVMKRAISVPVA